MQRLRTAVIGVGALGRHHARILSGLPDVELVAVADPNAEQGRAVAAACGCLWTPDYRTLLREVQAASIVVPTSLHRTVAGEFLKHSVHVLVEKPLAGSLDDGRELVRLAAEHRVTLQVGHIERFNPAFERLAEGLAAPRYLRCERTSPYAFRSMDISAVHDLMIHDIDLCLHLAQGVVQRVWAMGATLVGGRPDAIQARLEFDNGCIADLSALRVAPFVRRSLLAWTADGCRFADLQERKVTCYGAGPRMQAGELPWELAQQPGADLAALKQDMFSGFVSVATPEVRAGVDALTAELQDFVSAARLGRAPRVDGLQGLAALDIADRVLAEVHRAAASPKLLSFPVPATGAGAAAA